jgi:hypothetical protein
MKRSRLLTAPLIVAAAALLLLGGCAREAKRTSPAPKAAAALTERPVVAATNTPSPVVPRAEIRGEITSVNVPGRFVVLKFPAGMMPGKGVELAAYRRGERTADLRVTGPQRDLLTVADIVKGDCAVGDEVRGN